MKLLFAACAVAALSSAAMAAPTYIQAGRLIAVPGKPVRGPSTIIVDGGRIVAVRDGHVTAPDGAATIDLRTQTVLPGLIDSHVHLSSDRGGEAGLISFMREEPQMNALEAQMNGMKTLRAGFTTVRNLGTKGRLWRFAKRSSAAGCKARGLSMRQAQFPPPAAIWTGEAGSTTILSRICRRLRICATASRPAARSFAARSTAAPT